MAIKIGEYFVQFGKITRQQLTQALELQKKQPGFLGEILVGEKMITENDLLSYLAGIFNLQYITSEKLEKMTIQPNIAQIVPEKIAESKLLFPLKYEFKGGKLSLLTHAPQNKAVFDELKLILDNVHDITPVIAYSKSIKAIVAKQYRGDLIAFDRYFPKSVDLKEDFLPVGESVLDKDMLKQDAPRKDFSGTRKTSLTQIINRGEILQADGDTTITNRVNRLQNGVTVLGHEEFIEAVKVFTSIVDSIREGAFKNHTQRVVSLCIKLGKAYQLNEVEMDELVVAAYLHDAGKKKHVTSFDIKDKACADTIIKYTSAGVRLFSGCNLPKNTKNILSNMYEVASGEGYPQGLKTKDIPIGAQILLLADTFDYLSQVSAIPAPTAFFRIKATGHFDEKLLNTLKEEMQINTTAAGRVKLAGVVVTENRELLDQLAQEFGNHNVQVFTAPQIEIAALILKKQGEAGMNFVLADINVRNSQYTPFKLLSALRAKGIFRKTHFFMFATGGITAQDKEQATQLQASGLFPNLQIEKAVLDIIARSSS